MQRSLGGVEQPQLLIGNEPESKPTNSFEEQRAFDIKRRQQNDLMFNQQEKLAAYDYGKVLERRH
jgi:hypothetical protein